MGKSLHLQKIGQLAVRGSNPFPDGEPRRITITEECGKFYATVCHAIELLPVNTNAGDKVDEWLSIVPTTIANLKSFLLGIFHGVSASKLQKYFVF